jgi:hypothetical protein
MKEKHFDFWKNFTSIAKIVVLNVFIILSLLDFSSEINLE